MSIDLDQTGVAGAHSAPKRQLDTGGEQRCRYRLAGPRRVLNPVDGDCAVRLLEPTHPRHGRAVPRSARSAMRVLPRPMVEEKLGQRSHPGHACRVTRAVEV